MKNKSSFKVKEILLREQKELATEIRQLQNLKIELLNNSTVLINIFQVSFSLVLNKI